MLFTQPSDTLSPVIYSTHSSIQEPAPKDHKASRSSPLAPLKSHHINLFELLSICIVIFKEAQRARSITRSNHLSLWLKRIHPGSSVITHIMDGPVVKTLCFHRAWVWSLVGKRGSCITQSRGKKKKKKDQQGDQECWGRKIPPSPRVTFPETDILFSSTKVTNSLCILGHLAL